MNLEIKGLATKMQFFENYAKELEPKVQKEINDWANNTASLAVALAPADEGFLRNSIKPNYGSLSASVVVRADYGAYLEFGTRKFAAQYVASLPPDWQTFANTFRGPGGGSFEQFVMRLTKWILRKGIGATFDIKTHRQVKIGKQSKQKTAEADAYALAIYIVRNGIHPHPYLYPSVIKTTPVLIDNIKKVING